MVDLRRKGFYLVESHGRVVQIAEWTDSTLRIVDPETREEWTVRREPFEERVQSGRIQRVTPHWRPVTETPA